MSSICSKQKKRKPDKSANNHLKEKPYCEELCTNKHPSWTPKLQALLSFHSYRKDSFLHEPFPQSLAGFGKSGAHAHVSSASSCSAVCILWAQHCKQWHIPNCIFHFNMTESRDTLLLVSQGLYCFILRHWPRLQTRISCCCSEAPQWHQGWGFC